MTHEASDWLPRPAGNRRGQATARRLEAAAIDVAERVGVEATTVDEICAAAGCSRRTFFHHFPHREAALLGSSVPSVAPEAVDAYVTATGHLLRGAVELVRLPEPLGADPLDARRHALLLGSPHLQAVARARLLPAAEAVRTAVARRLEREGIDPGLLPDAVDMLTALTAAVIESSIRRGNPSPSATLDALAPVWERLTER